MLIKHLALVSLSNKLTATELSQTAAALQKQATRDFGPIWNIQATVDYFPDLKSVPLGYWPIIISENINQPGAAGFHTDKHHQPFSLVELDETWQLTCSHEMCEMLVDPYGNRVEAAGSLQQGQGKVNYLVEVCDPCEDASFAYSVNGILVSDFYTPNYFDPQAVPGVRYSYTGALTKPLDLKKNGYISWQDPITKKWYQATFFGGTQPVIKELQEIKACGTSLRSQVDKLTRNPDHLKSFQAKAKAHAASKNAVDQSALSMSNNWENEIGKFLDVDKGVSRAMLAEDAKTTATVTVRFNNAIDNSLTAILIRRSDDTEDSFVFTSPVENHTFDNVSSDDRIVLQSIAAGDADIEVSVPTDPATPMNIPGGRNRSLTVI